LRSRSTPSTTTTAPSIVVLTSRLRTATAITTAVTTTVTAVFPTTGSRTTGIGATAIATASTTAAIATTTAAIATTTTAIATASATTAWSAATGLCFIDAKGATHQLNALQRIDRCCFRCLIRHFNEREATLAAGVALERKGTISDFAMGGEQFNDVFLLSAEGQIADENAHFPGGPLLIGTDEI
jgi:hypothetical protein